MCINCSGLLCIMRGILLTFFISLKGKHFIRVVLSSSYQLGPCQLCVHTFIFIHRVYGRGIGLVKQQAVSSTIIIKNLFLHLLYTYFKCNPATDV